MATIATTSSARPVQASERLQVIDVLRGFALIGMIVVHFYYESNYSEVGINGYISKGIDLFIDSRFYTLFAILFGAGFALQFRKSEKSGQPFLPRYLRRLTVLLIFGIIIEIGFGYNILVRYAICGIPLLLIRKWPTRVLIILALVLAMFIPIYKTSLSTVQTFLSGAESAKAYNEQQRSRMQNFWKENHRRRDLASSTTSYATALSLRSESFTAFFSDWERVLLDYAWTFLLFLIGFYSVREGIFEHIQRKRKLIIGFMAFGLISWILAAWFLPLFEIPDEQRYPNVSYPVELFMSYLSLGFTLIRYEWLTLVYMGIILLLSIRPEWLRKLAFFSWAGRMALTNYVIQVALVSLLFNNYAFGVAGIEPALAPVYAILLFLEMVIFSQWWLSRYQFGPMEWLWRSVTYWQVQPLRREQSTGQLLSTEDVAVQPVEVTPLASDNSTPVE